MHRFFLSNIDTMRLNVNSFFFVTRSSGTKRRMIKNYLRTVKRISINLFEQKV